MSEYKTIKQVAREIKYEERMERLKEKITVCVYDEWATQACFKRMCIKVGNLKNKEIEALISELKKRHDEAMLDYRGEVFCFDKQIMYEVLITNPICKGICERNRYADWQDLVNRFFLS